MSHKTTYTKKQASLDKKSRERYKRLALPYDRLKFMSEGETNAIYLCDLESDAEDMDGAWYPMLAGFQMAEGAERFKSDTYENALAIAIGIKQGYARKFEAYKAECAELA